MNLRTRIHHKASRELDLALVRLRHGRTLAPLSDGDGPVALVASLSEFIYQLKLEAMLAKAFELKGYSPVFLIQPGSKTGPRFLRAFGMRRFVVLDDYVDAALDARARDEVARLLDANPSLSDLAQLTVERAAVGRFVVSTISRARHEGSVDLAHPDAQRLLRETLLVSVRSTFAAQALLDDLRPELVAVQRAELCLGGAAFGSRARARVERDPVRRGFAERLAGVQALHGRDAGACIRARSPRRRGSASRRCRGRAARIASSRRSLLVRYDGSRR